MTRCRRPASSSTRHWTALDLSTAAGRRTLEPLVRDLSTGSFGGIDDLLRLLRLEILDETPTHVVALGQRRDRGRVRRTTTGRRRPYPTRGALDRRSSQLAGDPGRPRPVRARGAHRARPGRHTDRDRGCDHADGVGCGWVRLEPTHARGRLGGLSVRPAASCGHRAVSGGPRVAGPRHASRAGAAARAGLWNAVSGCVQAVTLHDLLDEVTYGVLVAPWESAVGILS